MHDNGLGYHGMCRRSFVRRALGGKSDKHVPAGMVMVMVMVMMAMPHQRPTDERRSQIKWTSVRDACMAAATAAGTIKSQKAGAG